MWKLWEKNHVNYSPIETGLYSGVLNSLEITVFNYNNEKKKNADKLLSTSVAQNLFHSPLSSQTQSKTIHLTNITIPTIIESYFCNYSSMNSG